MAHFLSCPLLLTFFLPLLAFAQPNGDVTLGSTLEATENSEPWLSPSGDFAFGFQSIQGNNLFLLCIWYPKIPDKTIVWYANNGTFLPEGSKVELTADDGLVFSDPRGNRLWNSESVLDQVAYGFMNDTGNFMLLRNDSFILWQSFGYPTDTLLPTQVTEIMGTLYSRQNETNFSPGKFVFRLRQDGDLVLNTRNVFSNFGLFDHPYYISGTDNRSNSSNPGYQVVFNETGYMYILRTNGERFDLTPKMVLPAAEYYHRATLNFDGVFTQYYHPKSFTSNSSWSPVWSMPDNICVGISGGEGSGACGYNSVCRLNDFKRPICECPQGYSLVDPNDPYGSCKPSLVQSCHEEDSSSGDDRFDLKELIDTDWPTSDYEQLKPVSEAVCRNSCLNDCFCVVAFYSSNACVKKKLPLSYGRKDTSVDGKSFLKFRKDDLPQQPPPGHKGQRTLVMALSVLLGASLLANLTWVGVASLRSFLVYHNKIDNSDKVSNIVEGNVRCFAYKELAEATKGFTEELGRGSFGIVYKGVMQISSQDTVAVKTLDRVFQDGEKEFRSEVNAIAQTRHKNLVRLLGFCDEGHHRLLVYEYMVNGTLASFLFGPTKPTWEQRTHIAIAIARGLTYLHEECNNQIIHCDIKPQNILLDDHYNARICDFGLAKLLMIDQHQTNTAIRGTKGYVAPEWFRNTPVTMKVDVYSFGVVLLEIVSCRKSLEGVRGSKCEMVVLTDWAWDCFKDGKLNLLLGDDIAALNDWEKVERFLMVSFRCIQENPSLRPTMREVSQMLEGVCEVTMPQCPSPVSSVC